MKFAVASDHRGVGVKARICEQLRNAGHDVVDLGPVTEDSVDYPDYAAKVSAGISDASFDRGILICGTGMGMCIAANKYRGVRAALCHDEVTAEMSRRHNDANVLCMSADLMGEPVMTRIVEIWSATEFEGGRHARRLQKIADIEQHLESHQ